MPSNVVCSRRKRDEGTRNYEESSSSINGIKMRPKLMGFWLILI